LFSGLKKKISGFTNKIFSKTQKKVEEEEQEQVETPIKPVSEEKPIDDFKKDVSDIKESEISKEPVETSKPVAVEKEPVSEKSLKEKESLEKSSKEDLFEKTSVQEIKQTQKKTKPEKIQEKPKKQDSLTLEKQKNIKKSVFKSLKGIFSEKIKLSEKEINEFLEEFELSLLEADVSIDSANAIVLDLKERLVKEAFNKKDVLTDIKKRIKETLVNQLDVDCDINNYMKELKQKKPFIIMFVGPNGAGKTTTVAKFGKKFKDEGLEIVFSSSDTFRAGSIQQLEKHANILDIKIIKQNYGSDPAAVAFDAVSSAKANKLDLVLIDTAGRQETNLNLMQELKKIKKVVSPDLVIYVGESQAGQAIVDQVLKFKQEIGIDGVILTKLDTDPKGGVAISILNGLKLPIFFIGTGQEYPDLMKFSTKFIVDRVVE